MTPARRGAVALGALCLAAASATPLLLSAQPTQLRVEPSARVHVPGARMIMGADVADIHYAIDLCADEHPVSARSGCSGERFMLEMPPRYVRVDSFALDRTEVTQGSYRRCVLAGRCEAPQLSGDTSALEGEDLPVAGVRWRDAERFCEFAGGRLPTEVEWERAARGDGRRRFPWGRYFVGALANHGRPPGRPDASDGYLHAAPVGAFPDGASPYGALDMAGNVWEWTADHPRAGELEPGVDEAARRIARGGSWASSALTLRVTHRNPLVADRAYPDVGFRCAYSL